MGSLDSLKALLHNKKKEKQELVGDRKYIKKSELEEARLKRLREEEEQERRAKVCLLLHPLSEKHGWPCRLLTMLLLHLCGRPVCRRTAISQEPRLLHKAACLLHATAAMLAAMSTHSSQKHMSRQHLASVCMRLSAVHPACNRRRSGGNFKAALQLQMTDPRPQRTSQ